MSWVWQRGVSNWIVRVHVCVYELMPKASLAGCRLGLFVEEILQSCTKRANHQEGERPWHILWLTHNSHGFPRSAHLLSLFLKKRENEETGRERGRVWGREGGRVWWREDGNNGGQKGGREGGRVEISQICNLSMAWYWCGVTCACIQTQTNTDTQKHKHTCLSCEDLPLK